MKEIKRNPDGTVAKGNSLNPSGRPKGKKSEVAYNKLKADYDKQGKHALDRITEIADALFKKGELLQAMKGYIFVADKKYQITIHDHKLYLEEVKDRKKDDADIDDEENEEGTSGSVPIIFDRYVQKEA